MFIKITSQEKPSEAPHLGYQAHPTTPRGGNVRSRVKRYCNYTLSVFFHSLDLNSDTAKSGKGANQGNAPHKPKTQQTET